MSTIALIGPMGAGKTSIGRRVARRLGVRFTDTDAVVVREHGPIADLFASAGEPGFRALERDAVAAALEAGGVVSLGGGAVLDPATRADLGRCTVVLLTVSERAVSDRLRGARRPLLADDPGAWQRILTERLPLYEALADVRSDTSHRPMTGVATELADLLAARDAVPAATP